MLAASGRLASRATGIIASAAKTSPGWFCTVNAIAAAVTAMIAGAPIGVSRIRCVALVIAGVSIITR